MSDTPIFRQLAGEQPVEVPEAPDDGLTYSRFVPRAAGLGVLHSTGVHVQAHLSAIADVDDDPETRWRDVVIELRPDPDGVLIVGHLPDARPTAPYLRPGHDGFAGVDPQLVREVLGG